MSNKTIKVVKDAKGKKATVYLKGAIMYPHLIRKNEKSKAYDFDLVNLDKEQVTVLKGLKVRVKNVVKGVGVNKTKADDTRGWFVTLRSKNYPIKVSKADGTTYSDDLINSIGAGSTVVVEAAMYENTEADSTEFLLSPRKVVLNTYVPWEATLSEDVIDMLDDVEEDFEGVSTSGFKDSDDDDDAVVVEEKPKKTSEGKKSKKKAAKEEDVADDDDDFDVNFEDDEIDF